MNALVDAHARSVATSWLIVPAVQLAILGWGNRCHFTYIDQ